MSGMLAGVECARRRKFHKNSGLLDSSYDTSSSTRRSFLCLYTSSHEHNLTSRLSKERNARRQEYEDEKLGEVAREAKQRLDERFSPQCKSQNKRGAKGFKGLGQWRTYLVESQKWVISHDMTELDLTENMALDRKKWRSRSRVVG